MAYPAELRESLLKVEASRSRRMSETHPRLSPQEREEILRAFHPDYIADAFREIRVGPNKGDRAPLELAEALEGTPVVGEIPERAPDARCDVLVIGGGGAGASAALLAQESGAEVLLVTKLRFGDANTMMAQGGIQAADKANDSPALHYLDVLGGGGFKNDPNLV
ncbi:MAG: FAD-binding protein, partial [Anaerolineales bacterium]|nr:FAD-binding protein [Anaerolineales bacterium]